MDKRPLARTLVTPSDQAFPTGSSPRSQSHSWGTGPTSNVRPPGVVPALVSSGAALSMHLVCWGLSFPPQRTERRSYRTPRKDVRRVTWLWDWIRAHLTLREWHEWSQGLHRQSKGLEAQPRGLGRSGLAQRGRQRCPLWLGGLGAGFPPLRTHLPSEGWRTLPGQGFMRHRHGLAPSYPLRSLLGSH